MTIIAMRKAVIRRSTDENDITTLTANDQTTIVPNCTSVSDDGTDYTLSIEPEGASDPLTSTLSKSEFFISIRGD